MAAVKRLTATEDFLMMPLKARKCEVELFEECKTRRLLEECKCRPWEVPLVEVRIETILVHFFSQGMDVCGLKGRDCIEKNSAKTYNCSTTCEGIYADVQWREMLLEGEQLQRDGQGKMEKVDKEKYKMLVAEYRRFKAENVKHFRLSAKAISSAFGKLR